MFQLGSRQSILLHVSPFSKTRQSAAAATHLLILCRFGSTGEYDRVDESSLVFQQQHIENWKYAVFFDIVVEYLSYYGIMFHIVMFTKPERTRGIQPATIIFPGTPPRWTAEPLGGSAEMKVGHQLKNSLFVLSMFSSKIF